MTLDTVEISLDHTWDLAVDLHAVGDEHVDDGLLVLGVLLLQGLEVDALGSARLVLLNIFFDLGR